MPDTISKYYVNRRPNPSQPWATIADNLVQPNFIDTDPTARANGADYQAFGVTATNQLIPSKIVSAMTAAAGSFVWGYAAVSQLNGQLTQIASDINGNSAAAGFFLNQLTFQGNTIVSAGGSADGVLVNHNSGGTFRYGRNYGSVLGEERTKGVAFDSANNLVSIGTFGRTVDFGGQSKTAAHPPDGIDTYIFKLSPASTLTLVWVNQISAVRGLAIAVDSGDNILAAFSMNGATTFGATTLAPGTGLVKFNSSGVLVWAVNIPPENVSRIAADANNDVYVAGSIAVASAGFSTKIFCGKYSGSNGAANWTQTLGALTSAASAEFASGVTIGTGQTPYFSGAYGGASAFSSTVTDFFNQPNNVGGAFVAALSKTDGSVYWAKTPNIAAYGAGDESANDIASDANGNLYFTGKCNNAIYFGGLILLGGHDMFTAAMTPSGAAIWGKRSGPASGVGYGISVAPNRKLMLCGQVSNGTMYFDKSDTTSGSVSTTSGVSAPWVAQFNR